MKTSSSGEFKKKKRGGGNAKGHHPQLSIPQISDEQFVEEPTLSVMHSFLDPISGIHYQK